ncbi:ribosomal large subunit pseudouridine synthase B, partial [mine drainage metagenome]
MLLREAGIASRRGAEEFIRAGRVTVNGRQASLGESADPAVDEVLLDGRPLHLRQETVCYVLNKPRGVVTTLSDPEGRPSVADFVAGLPWRLFPVGRLDRDSEGLLLFTNDGELANGLMHPRHHVPKTYAVRLDQPVDARLRSLI